MELAALLPFVATTFVMVPAMVISPQPPWSPLPIPAALPSPVAVTVPPVMVMFPQGVPFPDPIPAALSSAEAVTVPPLMVMSPNIFVLVVPEVAQLPMPAHPLPPQAVMVPPLITRLPPGIAPPIDTFLFPPMPQLAGELERMVNVKRKRILSIILSVIIAITGMSMVSLNAYAEGAVSDTGTQAVDDVGRLKVHIEFRNLTQKVLTAKQVQSNSDALKAQQDTRFVVKDQKGQYVNAVGKAGNYKFTKFSTKAQYFRLTENSNLYISKLPTGKYTVKEIQRTTYIESGYKTDNLYKKVIVKKDTVSSVTFVKSKVLALGTIEVNARLGLADGSSQTEPLPNVVFDIIGETLDGVEVAYSIKTGEDGRAERRIPAGNYTLSLHSSPVPVNTNDYVFPFRIDSAFTGVRITIEIPDVLPTPPTPPAIISIKSTPNTLFNIKDTNNNIIYQGMTNENGTATIDSLPYGEYIYQEYAVPEGYALDTMQYVVKFTLSKSDSRFVAEVKKA